jgi:hypothetical protein
MSFTRSQVSRVVAVALVLLAAPGCGRKLYPVRGKVTYPDGKPVSGGLVVFELEGQEGASTPRGEIAADGSYELGTHKPRDGAAPGKYRVLVTPAHDPNAIDRPSGPPPIDPRYGNFKTSGLEVEVKTTGVNEVPLQVSRPKGGR